MDLRTDERLELLLLQALLGDLRRQVPRDHQHPVPVTDQHVTRIDRDTGTADRHVQVRHVVLRRPRRDRHLRRVGRERQLRQHVPVTQPAVGHDRRRPALPGPGHQHVPTRRRRRRPVGVDHQHLPRLQRLERLPLQRVAAAVRVEPVDVLAHRDEPHRERLAHEPVDHLAERLHTEQLRLAEPPLVQLGRDRRRTHLAQRLQHTLGQRLQLGSGHTVLLVGTRAGGVSSRRSGPFVGPLPPVVFRSLGRRRGIPQRFPLSEHDRGTDRHRR